MTAQGTTTIIVAFEIWSSTGNGGKRAGEKKKIERGEKERDRENENNDLFLVEGHQRFVLSSTAPTA